MAKKKSIKSDPELPSFEQCLTELEAIVSDLESGKLGLSDALARYEQGVGHLKSCHQLLQQAERKIELLSGIDAKGNPITEPFDEQEHGSLEEKAAARGRRRSSGARSTERKRSNLDDVDDLGRLF